MLSVQLDKIDKIDLILRRLNNLYRNSVLFRKLDSEMKQILSYNSEFKGKYTGKRCFILGNAPSVNKLDFRKLENELVMTVNDMVLHKNFNNLKSNFHFIADPYYLNLKRRNKRDAAILEKMNSLSGTETTFFFPVSGRNAVRKYGWQNKIDIRYFYSNLYFYDNYRETIDFTKYIPDFWNVVHWCIIFAIFLGCNEIYLLGCDFTNLVIDFMMFTDKDVNYLYAHDYSEEEEENIKRLRRSYGLEYWLYAYWKMVHSFSELKRLCQRNGAKLYNCSSDTILDNIAKRNIDDIL